MAAVGSTFVSFSKAGASLAEAAPHSASGFANDEILRQPDAAIAYGGIESPIPLSRQGSEWTGKGVLVTLGREEAGEGWTLRLASPTTAVSHVHLRWNLQIPSDVRCIGDAWERSYGDLEWRGIVPERVMPWYFLAFDGHTVRGYGVKTQPAAFCFWQLDAEGVSLWADVRNGGMPLQLGQRQLEVATVVSRKSEANESPFAAAQVFCRAMCAKPRLPGHALFGSNDWYYAYGHNTADGILRDADLMAQVAPAGGARPFVVIDDGWQDPKRFPSMTDLAARIASRSVRPGLWIRPLRAPSGADSSLLLPDARFGQQAQHASLAWDPTIPEALEQVLASIRQPMAWGYEFIKHDFSTFDMLGRWGFAMGALPAEGTWQFADRTRTTAEIVAGLYRSLREAAGDKATILGCNTVGHLSAGLFESQRIGDDASGTAWERTRRMGVNALGLRLPQHRTFFWADPDCVALTPQIDWTHTRQWLDVVARSGVSLFVSPDTQAVGPEQRAALQEAFARVGSSSGSAEDWLDTTSPQQWRFDAESRQSVRYDWSGPAGAIPFPI
ncbi:MAG: hypothetical protein ACLGXA_11340 [Acidobacteriota bacterium]